MAINENTQNIRDKGMIRYTVLTYPTRHFLYADPKEDIFPQPATPSYPPHGRGEEVAPLDPGNHRRLHNLCLSGLHLLRAIAVQNQNAPDIPTYRLVSNNQVTLPYQLFSPN